MKRIFTLAIVVLAMCSKAQSIDMVTVTPQNLLACQSFDVIVDGIKPMPQFFIVNHTINVTSNFINIVINWDAPPIGNPMLAPYTYTVPVPANTAPAGMWGLVVTNVFLSTGNVTGSNTQTITLGSCCSAVADISISQNAACYNDTLTVTDASCGYASLTWYLNGTPLGTNPGNFEIYGLPAGNYTLLQVADTLGCSTSDSVMFSFGFQPDNGFNVIQNGHNFTFSATGSTSLSYAWDFGDGSSATGNVANHTYAADGQYQVCLTSTNAANCVADSCTTVNYSTVGLDDNRSTKMSVYPNPASQMVTITNAAQQPRIYDVLGRECVVKFTASGKEWKASIAHLPKGMYLVQAGDKVMKLVKE